MEINFQDWEKIIKEPTWHLTLVPELKELAKLKDQNLDSYEETKEKVYSFFEDSLINRKIYLGKEGKNWDEERKDIDTVIIHHTSNLPGMSLERLSAIELVRLYAPYYFAPYLDNDKDIKGQSIWSNHAREGKQVFYPYHWLIRMDGTVERLLEDEEIGWHAGNWDVNCRSVAICFDNDFENSQPTPELLNITADIINKNYPQIKRENILGHNEINLKTTCPSQLFLSNQERRGWKEDLLDFLNG